MKTRLLFWVFILVISLLAAGCARESADLQGDWLLVSYGDANAPTQALPGVETNVSFDAAGQVQGTVGCNSFSGRYTVKDSQLLLGPLVATEMFCEQISEQESAVFGIFNTGELNMTMEEQVMTLTSADQGSVVILQRK
jgi:heat shock protein HslJ